jgi:hypothetical protein
MHAPNTQCAPPVHAGSTPHWHVPVAEQLSAVVRSHVTQDPPPTPQVASELVVQTPLAQQPVGQVVALQTQVPDTHCAPEPQEGFPWQLQVPVVASQPSLFLASHGWHALPPRPQASMDGVWHTPPEQQPLGQDCALHTHAPLTQAVPAPQIGFAPHWH